MHSNDQGWYALRYHDIRRNEYVRYFRGHTGPLNTLAMSPKNDIFMSASQVRVCQLLRRGLPKSIKVLLLGDGYHMMAAAHPKSKTKK
jgi:WD40 repeat protein